MSDKHLNPEDIQKFLQEKLGSGVQVQLFPQAQKAEDEEGGEEEDQRSKALEFSYKPSDIKEYLDRYVIEQNDAKKVLATAICDHYHHLQLSDDSDAWRDYKKQNILLIGPTGVGKTYLIQNIARLIGVPFVKADATKYSETGYVDQDYLGVDKTYYTPTGRGYEQRIGQYLDWIRQQRENDDNGRNGDATTD